MDQKSILLTMMIVIMSSQLTIVRSNLHRGRRETKPGITLKEFQRPVLIAANSIKAGATSCATPVLEPLPSRTKYAGVDSMECDGWLENCYRMKTGGSGTEKYCKDAAHHLTYAEWKNGTSDVLYGNASCSSKSTVIVPTADGSGKISDTCICHCIEHKVDADQDAWAFSLQEMQSNISLNKVITGVRIKEDEKLIHLEIEEKTLGSTEAGTWKSLKRASPLVKDTHFSLLVPTGKAIQLGAVFVPSDHVITGVKFSRKSVSYEGQSSAIQLEVQGTKFDKASKKLDTTVNKWFTPQSSTLFPESAFTVKAFRTTSKKDGPLDSLTIPILDANNVTGKEKFGLRGIVLACENCGKDTEVILPKVYGSDELKPADKKEPPTSGDLKKPSDVTEKSEPSGVGDIGSNKILVVTLFVSFLCFMRFQ